MVKNFVLVFLLLVFNLSFLSAQVQEEWVARYNGPANDYDRANALAVDRSQLNLLSWS